MFFNSFIEIKRLIILSILFSITSHIFIKSGGSQNKFDIYKLVTNQFSLRNIGIGRAMNKK